MSESHVREPLTDQQLAEWAAALANRGAEVQNAALAGMHPETAAQLRAHLGIKPTPPWEQFGVSRATFYRMQQAYMAAPNMDMFDQLKKLALDGASAAEMRRAAGLGPVNSPTSRAMTGVKALSDMDFFGLVVLEMRRRWNRPDMTMIQVGNMFRALGAPDDDDE